MTAPWEPTPREPDCECGHAHEDHEHVTPDNWGDNKWFCTLCACIDHYPDAAYWRTREREFGRVSR